MSVNINFVRSFRYSLLLFKMSIKTFAALSTVTEGYKFTTSYALGTKTNTVSFIHTHLYKKLKPGKYITGYPFLAAFLTKKGYYGNEGLGSSDTFILSYTLLYNLIHFYTTSHALIRSQAKHLYLFLTYI